MKNLTARPVTIHQGVKVATMSVANIVPHMLAPEEVGVQTPTTNLKYDKTIPMKGASMMEESRSSPIEGGVQRGSIESPHRQRAPSKAKNPKLTEHLLKVSNWKNCMN